MFAAWRALTVAVCHKSEDFRHCLRSDWARSHHLALHMDMDMHVDVDGDVVDVDVDVDMDACG